jgi:hypothetical protein
MNPTHFDEILPVGEKSGTEETTSPSLRFARLYLQKKREQDEPLRRS